MSSRYWHWYGIWLVLCTWRRNHSGNLRQFLIFFDHASHSRIHWKSWVVPSWESLTVLAVKGHLGRNKVLVFWPNSHSWNNPFHKCCKVRWAVVMENFMFASAANRISDRTRLEQIARILSIHRAKVGCAELVQEYPQLKSGPWRSFQAKTPGKEWSSAWVANPQLSTKLQAAPCILTYLLTFQRFTASPWHQSLAPMMQIQCHLRLQPTGTETAGENCSRRNSSCGRWRCQWIEWMSSFLRIKPIWQILWLLVICQLEPGYYFLTVLTPLWLTPSHCLFMCLQ